MDISTILDEVSTATGKRLMSISTDEERFVLPVTPWKYSVQLEQNNKTVDILDYGEMLTFGHRKLHRLKFSCFFPATKHKYPYVLSDYSPRECIEILNKFKMDMAPVHVILTDSPINQYFAINEIRFSEKDGSGDINYEIDLVEYRDFNIPESNYTKKVNSLTGLKDRAGIRTTASIESFLEHSTRDISEAVRAITGGSASVSRSSGKSDGSQELVDMYNTYRAFSGDINPTTIKSTINVVKNPIGTIKGGLKGIGNSIKSVFKGIGSIFGF